MGLNPRKSTPRYLIVKYQKIKDKGKKSWKQKETTSYQQRKNNSKDNTFLIRNHRGQQKVTQHFSSAERKELWTRILYPAWIPFKNEGKMREFVTSISILKRCYLNRKEMINRKNFGTSGRKKEQQQ